MRYSEAHPPAMGGLAAGGPALMTRGVRHRWPLSALVVAGCILCATGVAADEIVDDSTTYTGVRIVDLEGGRIAYRTPAGAFRYAPLARVTRVSVDTIGTLGDLNEAEAYLAKGDFVRALVHYERAVKLASGFWSRLVRARYIRACDRADRIDTLAKQFTRLLEDEKDGPPVAAELLPMTSPRIRSRGTRRALNEIEKVIDRAPSQSGRVLLEMLRFQIVRRGGEGDTLGLARALVRQPIPPLIATRSVYRVERAALITLLDSGALSEVLGVVNEGLENAPLEVLPELLMVKARALLDSAKDDETAMRAGWAAMRVVIHYKDDVLVPEALLLAARVHERIGRVPTALQLLDECAHNARASASVKARVVEMEDRLKSMG